MGTMKMKNFFCLLSLYGFLSMNTIAAVFNILVVNTEIVLSVNDRPSLVSTKKSESFFEIVEIQFVVMVFGAQRFEITFAV